MNASTKQPTNSTETGAPSPATENPHTNMAGCMGFVWVTAFSFFRCVASPFHSFVTTYQQALLTYEHTGHKAQAQ